MRIVIDTNTAVSGLLWEGTPARLLDLANENEIDIFTSAALLKELRVVLLRAKFARRIERAQTSVEELLLAYQAVACCVSTTTVPRVVPTDPDDDHVIACAMAAHADLIVSGDSDLLDLKQHYDIRIVTAKQAVDLIQK